MREQVTCDSIIQSFKKATSIFSRKSIVCHPDNLDLLKKLTEPEIKWNGIYYEYNSVIPYGVEIRVDKHLPKYARRWEFPEDRFIEYEKSDERWAIPVGFGRWVETDEPLFYLIDYGMLDDYFCMPIYTPKYLLSSLS